MVKASLCEQMYVIPQNAMAVGPTLARRWSCQPNVRSVLDQRRLPGGESKPSFMAFMRSRHHSIHTLSQWEMTLQCNVVSHWMSVWTEWCLEKCWGFPNVFLLVDTLSWFLTYLTNSCTKQFNGFIQRRFNQSMSTMEYDPLALPHWIMLTLCLAKVDYESFIDIEWTYDSFAQDW